MSKVSFFHIVIVSCQAVAIMINDSGLWHIVNVSLSHSLFVPWFHSLFLLRFYSPTWVMYVYFLFCWKQFIYAIDMFFFLSFFSYLFVCSLHAKFVNISECIWGRGRQYKKGRGNWEFLFWALIWGEIWAWCWCKKGRKLDFIMRNGRDLICGITKLKFWIFCNLIEWRNFLKDATKVRY
jgi:hypothetical protein